MKNRLVILLLWGLIALHPALAQQIFVSSDGNIFMTTPDGWQVHETQKGVITATQTDTTAQLVLTYGETLENRLIMLDPFVDLEPLALKQAALMFAQSQSDAVLLGYEQAFARDVYRYQVDDISYFVINSEITGLTLATVTDSDVPYEDFLQFWFAYEAPPLPIFDCDALTLNTSQALPGGRLEVTGLPYGLSDFQMQAVADDVADVMPLIAVALEDEAYLTAPLYPDLRLQGGAVTIQAIHEGKVCAEIPFTVKAMPKAPGEIDRYLVAANRYIDATIRFLNITRDDLMQTSLPNSLLPVAEMIFYLDHPDNPNSFVNLVAEASDSEIRLLEALLANDGYVDYLNRYADFLDEQPPLTPVGTASIAYLSSDLPEWQINEFDILTKIDIPNADKLSYYMRFQGYWEGVSSTASSIFGDVGLTNSSLGIGAGALSKRGVISSGAASKGGIVGATVGVAMFTASTMIDLYRHLLPSEFTRVDPQLSTYRFTEEDDNTVHQLEEVWVNVKSRKWVLTKTVVDGILTGLSSAGAAKEFGKLAKAGSNVASAAAKGGSVYADTAEDALATIDLASNFCGVLGGSSCNTETLSIGPYTWSNITLDVQQNNGLYVEFEIAEGLTGSEPSITIFDKIQYLAINDGNTVVKIRPLPEAFGGATSTRKSNIFVDRIAVYVDVQQYADPGDLVCATSSQVSHAEDESLEWTLYDKEGQLLQQERTMGDAPHEFCFTIPEPEGDGVTDYATCKNYRRDGFIITAESLAQHGARFYNRAEKPRIGTEAVYIEEENDVCDGLWQVQALQEEGDVCTASPALPEGADGTVMLQTIMNDLIASGDLNSVLDIESNEDNSVLTITDMIANETQTINRVMDRSTLETIGIEMVIDGNRPSNGERVELIGDNGDLRLVRAAVDSTVWLDGKRYRRTYRPPLPPYATADNPLTLDIMFTSAETFLARVAWYVVMELAIETVTYTLTCDIDVIYGGELISLADVNNDG